MAKVVLHGAKEPVEIKLEFEGTIHNHIVLVEDQFIPTGGTNTNRTGTRNVGLDGDPIKLILYFKGEIGSKIKVYKLKINGYTYSGPGELKLKVKEMRVETHIPYSFFDLTSDELLAEVL